MGDAFPTRGPGNCPFWVGLELSFLLYWSGVIVARPGVQLLHLPSKAVALRSSCYCLQFLWRPHFLSVDFREPVQLRLCPSPTHWQWMIAARVSQRNWASLVLQSRVAELVGWVQNPQNALKNSFPRNCREVLASIRLSLSTYFTCTLNAANANLKWSSRHAWDAYQIISTLRIKTFIYCATCMKIKQWIHAAGISVATTSQIYRTSHSFSRDGFEPRAS